MTTLYGAPTREPMEVSIPPTAADFPTIRDGPQSTPSGRSLSLPSMTAHAPVPDLAWVRLKERVYGPD